MHTSFQIFLSKNLSITEIGKKKCRILNFHSKWTVEEIICEIVKLNGRIFKNLFIFELKLVDEEEIGKILDYVRRFCEKRPLVIIFSQESDEQKQLFYTSENRSEWIEVLEVKDEKFEKIQDFSTFYRWFMTKKNVDMHTVVTEACEILINPDQLILRFLVTLNLSIETHFHLLSHCAANFSKAQFLAVLGIPFGNDERFLDESQSRFIRKTFTNLKRSILESAIKNENHEVLKYLISYCSHLIRQLPISHQQKVNTELIKAEKIDILCDLLEFCDFVFPSNFELQKFSNKRFQIIADDRENFHNAIKNENYDKIYEFIKGSGLKFARNIKNNTALFTALDSRKFAMFYHLMSLGFKTSNDSDKLLGNLNKDDEMKKAKNDSLKNNLKESQAGDDMAINFLTARSKIFGKHSAEEHEKIRKWFLAINSIKQGKVLLNAASQCTRLEIIFDFESEDVARVDLESQDADGIMYPVKKLVIVAAKHSTIEQEQKVKGVLAHELFHYVMRITFENEEQPYLNKYDERYKIYQNIVRNLRREFLSSRKDDECEEIVSSVFRSYKNEDEEEDDDDVFHAELIVRPIQILVHYDFDQYKVKQLKDRYKPLFDFVDKHLVSAIDKLDLRKREAVRNFNNSAGLTSKFFSKKRKTFEFLVSKGIENIIDKNLVIAQSNIPKLLLAHFYNQLRIQDENLVDARNIFISSEQLENAKNELKDILEEVKSLKVFIDFSKGNYNSFDNFPSFRFSKFFFVTSSNGQSQELLKILKNKVEKIDILEVVEINYEWKDLTKGTQKELLRTEVNFQNNSKITLSQVFESPEDIIDTELLNTILVNLKISINSNEETEQNFHQLFRKRNFIWKNELITLEELLKKTINEKYVLISDVAGTGKSWAMKNISKMLRDLYPKKWVTFVDLKQLIPAFKEQNKKLNFHDFFVNEILKKKPKFEVEIFKQKYRTGNSLIFFDGFDEIAPDSATFVQQLMKSFESNPNSALGHNQLWISTRDFCEIDLCEELEASFTCKLAEFTVEDGINLISIIWRLYDLRDNMEVDFNKDVVESKEIKNYKKVAQKICLEMPTSNLEGIGQPLIYKMLAEVMKEKKAKFTEEKFSSYQLFEKFWKISKEDWSHKKGIYRMNVSNKNEKHDLHFHRVHQLKAMQKFMPGKENYCDIDVEEEEWEDEDLIGCGLMTKKGESYFFIHETFSEFFVAQFIMRILSKKKLALTNVFEFIKVVVTNPKHDVIRMLLNEGLAAEKISQKELDKKAQKIATKAELCLNLYKIFTKNLRNLDELGSLWFLILKHWNYQKLVDILTEDITELLIEHGGKITENSIKIFLELFTSGVDIATIKELLQRIAEKTCQNIIKEVIEFRSKLEENIFFMLQQTKTMSEKMFEKFIKILEEYRTKAKIAEKLMANKILGGNVLFACIGFRNIRNLKIFWTGCEKYLVAEQFKELLMQKTTGLSDRILQHMGFEPKTADFHEEFWSLLLKTYENEKQELMKHLIFYQDVQGFHFMYKIVLYNNSDVLNWTLMKLKSTFNEDEVREILKVRSFQNANLIQYAARSSKQSKKYQTLLTFLLEFYPNDILEISMETDVFGDNLLYYIVRYSTAEHLQFYIKELDKLVSNDEMRTLLCCLNDCGRNLLQHAAFHNNSLELHENLWKIIRKYFNPSEILKFLSYQDHNGDNFLKYKLAYESKEVIKFTQTEVINQITGSYPHALASIEELKLAIESKILNPEDEKVKKVLSLKWIYQGSSSFAVTKDMNQIALNSNKTIHLEYWKALQEQFKEQEIKEILLRKNIFGENFFHQVLRNESLEVIQLTFEHIKSVDVLKEILKSTNLNGQNLVQSSAIKAVDITVVDFLWKFLKSCLNSDEIFDILKHKDKFENDLLLHIAAFGTGEVAELVWKQIEGELQIDKEKLKTHITERNLRGQNVLHVCCQNGDSQKLIEFWMGIQRLFNNEKEFKEFVKQKVTKDQTTILHKAAQLCKKLEFHETLWILLLMTFQETEELKDFLLSQHDVGNIFLFNLVRFNTSNIAKFTLEQCQKTLSPTQFDQLLKSTGLSNRNIVHEALIFTKDIEIYKILWKYLLRCESFMSVLTGVESDGWSIINFVVNFATLEIMDFICEELEKLNDKGKVKKIILSGGNLLTFDVNDNENLENLGIHKRFWKLARKFLDTTDILQLIHSVDTNGYNLLQVAVKYNTKEVIEFTWTELETFLNATERTKYLWKRSNDGLNLIGIATKCNRPNEVIDLVRGFIKTSQNENLEESRRTKKGQAKAT